MRLLKLLLILCVWDAAVPAFAGPVEDARSAFFKGDYPTALRLFRSLANQGNASSQTTLGAMYETGLGVPQDYEMAVFWFRKAAEQGYALAEVNLAYMYDVGWGVPRDPAAAASWLRSAADKGYASAQGSLGQRYEKGLGVPQDYVQAHMWYNLAAARGESEASGRDRVEAKMTPAQIAEAQKLAREWKAKPER